MSRLISLVMLIVGINLIATGTHGDTAGYYVASILGAVFVAIANALIWEGITHGSRNS